VGEMMMIMMIVRGAASRRRPPWEWRPPPQGSNAWLPRWRRAGSLLRA